MPDIKPFFHLDDYDQFIDPARVKVLNDGDVWEM